MSLPVSTLRILLSKGVDPDTILEVAEAAEAERAAAEEARREKRRESNRRRQKAWYDRHVRNNCDNAVSSSDNAPNAVMQREDGEGSSGKKVLEPKKLHPEVKTLTLPSEAFPFSPKPRRFDWPTDFREQFWAAYRRKTDRKKAMVALERLHRMDRTAWEPILAGAERLSASDTETEFLPHASTWLRNERWNDELPPKAPRGPHGGAPLPPRRKTSNGFYDIAREPDLGDYDEQHPAPQRNLLRFASGGRH